MQESFTNSEGEIQITESSAKQSGGASAEVCLGLWHDFEMAIGSGRSTLESENRKGMKRF